MDITTDEDTDKHSSVFAVGDVREKKVRQIATATGDGVIAGVIVEKYLAEK